MSHPAPFDLTAEVCWPTLFFHCAWADHAQEAPGLLDFLYREKAVQGEAIASGVAARAKAGIYESRFDLFTTHPGLAKLLAFIGQSLGAAVCHVEGGRVQPQDLDTAVVESWFYIANRGGFHDAHLHPNCSWCGIYYVQVGDSGRRVTGGAPNDAVLHAADARLPGRRQRLSVRGTRRPNPRRPADPPMAAVRRVLGGTCHRNATACSSTATPDEELAKRVQLLEWRLLFEHRFQIASA